MDLHRKSMDSFPYDGDLLHKGVKGKNLKVNALASGVHKKFIHT